MPMKNIYLLLLFASIGAFSQSSYAQPNGTCWTEPTKITEVTIGQVFSSNKAGSTGGPIIIGSYNSYALTCAPNPSNKALKYTKGTFGPGANATGTRLHLTDYLDVEVWIDLDHQNLRYQVPFSDKTGLADMEPPSGGGSDYSSIGWMGRMTFLLTKDVVGGALTIPAGLYLAQTYRSVSPGIYASSPAWVVKTAGEVIPVTAICTINNGNTISVPFGDIVYDQLKTSGPSSTIKKDIPLTYSCSSSLTQNIDITLSATPSSFNSKAIKSSINNVGVVMMYDGKEVSPNASFSTKIVNGVGNDTITFSPIIAEGAPEVQGEFTASATLIMTSA